jgi:hypothetical protein
LSGTGLFSFFALMKESTAASGDNKYFKGSSQNI